MPSIIHTSDAAFQMTCDCMEIKSQLKDNPASFGLLADLLVESTPSCARPVAEPPSSVEYTGLREGCRCALAAHRYYAAGHLDRHRHYWVLLQAC